MAFTTDAATKQDLADTLQVDLAALPTFWTNLNVRSHAWAYNQIVSTLAARGFTATQISQWDRGSEFERDLTIYRNLCNGAAGQNLAKEFIDSFDRRDELSGNDSAKIKPVAVTISGAFVAPAGTVGVVSLGAESTGGDLFVMDPEDGRIGETTRW